MTHRIFLTAILALLLCTSSFANLHDRANSADYIIIAPHSVIQSHPWINLLADWRTQHGRVARVVPSDSIWAEFGIGAPNDYVLRDFLWYAYHNWSAPQLKDVFIIGWHNVVPLHIEPDSTQYMDSTGQYYWHRQDYLSDYFYTMDPDSNNHLPAFSLGRLPWDPDSSELWDYYQKISAYEAQTDQDWQHRVHLIADTTDNAFNFWQNFAEPVAGQVQTGYTIERDYCDSAAGQDWHGDRQSIIDHFNAGSYLSMFFGHGGAGIWSASLSLTFEMFDSLRNAPHFPIMVGFSYDVASPFRPSSAVGPIAASLLSNPNGGAIVYFGRSTVAWALAGINYRQILTRLATSDSVQTTGDLWRKTQDEYARANPGGFGHYSSVQQTLYGSSLFGDPGIRLPNRSNAVEHSRSKPPSALNLSSSPNPFNAVTQIQFELSRASAVKLQVMNILGQQVATLAEGPLAAGHHDIAWNARDIPSGIYFAVLQTGNERYVRKMMLLK